MADPLIAFLERPSGELFAQLRDALVLEPAYDFHADDEADLTECIERGDDAGAAAMRRQLMPNWLLSPRVHQLLGDAAQRSGDLETAQREHYFAQANLRGLLHSGDGSQARPFLVTHIADEYDVLQSLGKEFKSQRPVNTESGSFDIVTCGDGTDVWFDVTPGFRSTNG